MGLLRLFSGTSVALGIILSYAAMKKDFPGEAVIVLLSEFKLDYTVLRTRADYGLFFAIVILTLIVVILAVVIAASSIKKKTRNLDFLLNASGLFPNDCDDESLSYIAKAGSERFPTATNENETIAIHRADPQAFKVVKNKSRENIGYYCLLRLTQSGVKSVEKGEFSLKNLQLAHIRQDKKRTDCDIYIGAINCTAFSLRAPGFIEGYALKEIQNMKPRRIFARAATPRGLRLLLDYGFKPVSPSRTGIDQFYQREGYR